MSLPKLIPCSLSLAGRHHGFDPTRNEDAVCFRKNANYAALVLADGVSSANRSREGAALVTELFADLLTENGRTFFVAPPAQTAQLLVLRAQDYLQAKAEQEHCTPTDLACTAVLLLYARRSGQTYYLSLGDSLPVVVANGVCTFPAPPEEYPAGTPAITTPNAAGYVRAGIINAKDAASLMVCSDGAWREFYRGGTIHPEYAGMLSSGDLAGLARKLESIPHADDCTFLAVSLKQQS